jgi:CheY-like chemotaxis protein
VTDAPPLPKILVVDDEERVLAGMRVVLRKSFTVVMETSPVAALRRVEAGEEFAVVVSDMRMPEMNGSQLLAKIRAAAPDTVRMLLTGFAEVDAAVAAINDGQVFRFLVKPCPPPKLRAACQDALKQHELVIGERILLEQTLRGAIQTLTQILALARPKAFGHGRRQGRLAVEVARRVGHPRPWAVELAAMLGQIGYIALDEALVDKLYGGEPLQEHEQSQLRRLPRLVDGLLAHIPRLEEVRGILRCASRPQTADDAARLGAEIMRAVSLHDAEAAAGYAPGVAVRRLAAAHPELGAPVLAALESVALEQLEREVVEVRVGELLPGMILASDLLTQAGGVLLTRGQEVTAAVIERLAIHRGGGLHEPVRVVRPADGFIRQAEAV